MIFLKLESRKLRAYLEILLKGLEENFYYFKYTNVTTIFFIMPLTADSVMMILYLKSNQSESRAASSVPIIFVVGKY